MSDSSDGVPGSGGRGAERPSEAAGRDLELRVPGMDCPSCAKKVRNALERTEGILAYETRPTSGTVTVTLDGAAGEADVVRAIEAAGYEVADGSRTGADAKAERDARSDVGGRAVWRSPRAIKTAIAGAFLGIGLLASVVAPASADPIVSVLGVSFPLVSLLYLGAVAVGGQVILRNGYYSARARSLDIDFLMSAAIVSAVLASLLAGERLYFEAATLAVLFNLAELLETHAMDRTRDSLRELMDLSPAEATVRRDGEEATVPVEDVASGEVVVVRPGERVPVDGEVRNGTSAVNQAPITGESVPVDKAPGEAVYAGTINEEGYLEIEATAEAADTTLSRIVDLVQEARNDRTEREQFVDRFAGYYTPFMVAVAIAVAAIPPVAFGASWGEWFVAGITMLVLACPCAFVISTPVSVVSGITSAARNGVLIKGGSHLEAMGSIEAIALDKTGTLTEGELAVTDVVALGENSAEDVLRCARGLEERSEHPIGEAIVARADEAAVDRREVTDFESLTGKGVRASLDGTRHYAGRPDLFDDLGFDLSHAHVVDEEAVADEVRDLCDRQGCLDLVEDTIPRLQREGKTVVLVGRTDELEGIVAVADEVRPEARDAIARLRDLDITTVMLTGDNAETARSIAEQVGIEEYRAELLPEEKVDALEALMDEYDGVAMVGDGINDAPALATASVGIAMGAAGTDTALETADVALMADDLSKVPYLAELARRANGVIRQNIYASLGVKAILAAGVPLGYVSVALAVLAGDAGMTLGVTGNAMRLSRLRPERSPGRHTAETGPNRPESRPNAGPNRQD